MKKPGNINRRVAALLLLSLACAAAARGQQQRAHKIDETDYTRCDLSEMNVVNDLGGAIFKALAERPEAKAAVVVYSPRAGDAMRYTRWVKEWMSERRGVEPGRLLEVYGGHAAKRRLEFWLVPAGAEPPPDAPPVARVGVTLFVRYGYYPGDSCPETRLPALEAFAQTLKRLPGWRGTIVLRPHVNRRGARGDEEFDYSPLTRRQAARRAAGDRLHLIRQLGLDPARIRVVVGASDSWAHGELWLIPPAAAPTGFHYDFR
jgi:hypothetical protein